MTCDELRTYLETTLSDERQAQPMDEIRQHAQECPACTAYLSELLQLEQELGELPSIPAATDLLGNVMKRIGKESSATTADTARELAWCAAMLLGLGVAAMAWSWPFSSAQWIGQLWDIRAGAPIAGPMKNLLQQPMPVLVAGGLGMVLIVFALFRERPGSGGEVEGFGNAKAIPGRKGSVSTLPDR